MLRRICGSIVFALLASHVLNAQQSVCELFEDLNKAAEMQRLNVKGELFISGEVAVLASANCDNEFVAEQYRWPTVINLRPSAALPQAKRRSIENAAAEIRSITDRGKVPSATAVFHGRLNVRSRYEWGSTQGGTVGNAFGPNGSFPAELVYDDVTDLVAQELPAPNELPVVPICDLFKNLRAWKGERVAVRAQVSSTFEGAWLNGDCKDRFVTDGLRWPASLVMGSPAYYSGGHLDFLFGRNEEMSNATRLKESELIRGRRHVSTAGTYVGRLRVRDEYFATCSEDGEVRGYGYGHLNYAPAELIVEAFVDVEVAPMAERIDSNLDPCRPVDYPIVCAEAESLEAAARIGCAERVQEFLRKNGIDSKGPAPSSALQAAIRNGHRDVVEFLLAAGAPVNPETKSDFESPVALAASNVDILRLLINAGLKVDQKNKDGETYLATYGYFDSTVRELLNAGADPNARDKHGATALMHASAQGYEIAVKLLIQHGANVNLVDEKGRTALMYAAEGSYRGAYYVDAIPLLLSNGAELSMRDNTGRTALDIATRLKHKYAIELLQESEGRSGDRLRIR